MSFMTRASLTADGTKSSARSHAWLATWVGLIVGGYVAGNEARCSELPTVPAANWDADKLGPRSSLSVAWIGHSLMEHQVDSTWGRLDLMSLVGRFAESRKLSYAMTDHTLFGSPLSALWRGRPHSYARDASAMVAKREALVRDAARYDAIVLTEAIPLLGTMRTEFSAYYLRRFYCSVLAANPLARVYLYQTWTHFQGSDRGQAKAPPHPFDWRGEMEAERALWEELAETARKPAVAAPTLLSRLGWKSIGDGGCTVEAPIFIVPVGDALLALDERLRTPHPGDRFLWPDGRPLRMTDLVENPLLPSTGGTAVLRDPSKPMDDIHPSLVGVYFSALVNFATLYRQTPVGLPYPVELGPLATALQCVAWNSVLRDTRAGVKGKSC